MDMLFISAGRKLLHVHSKFLKMQSLDFWCKFAEHKFLILTVAFVKINHKNYFRFAFCEIQDPQKLLFVCVYVCVHVCYSSCMCNDPL